MKRLLEKLKNFTRHPLTQLVTGLVLLISGGTEIVFDFLDAEHSWRLGAHHGVALFGIMQMLGSLPELVEGIDRSLKAVDERQAK